MSDKPKMVFKNILKCCGQEKFQNTSFLFFLGLSGVFWKLSDGMPTKMSTWIWVRLWSKSCMCRAYNSWTQLPTLSSVPQWRWWGWQVGIKGLTLKTHLWELYSRVPTLCSTGLPFKILSVQIYISEIRRLHSYLKNHILIKIFFNEYLYWSLWVVY